MRFECFKELDDLFLEVVAFPLVALPVVVALLTLFVGHGL
jgi:hypothetical protein